ncbi:hypothetical protein M9Y10_008338 [Tritrichomonas musculus]|uniref:Guanylate cyclase domain-containing protein n=1 Tax=Tritrichomonas musculus TaxID=1915356 RepID=A0ABR2IY68_9EUKA
MKKSSIIGRDYEFFTAARVFKFSSVIDISFWAKFFHSLIEYFAKINTTSQGAHLMGYIFCILFFLQTIIPSLIINSVELWPRDSIITNIFRIVCSFCDGPSVDKQDERIYVSFSLSFIFLLSFILVCFRSKYFSKLQILTSTESSLMIFYFKYILVFFLPLLLSGFPLSIYKLSYGDYSFFSISVVIFVPIIYISYITAMLFLIFPRVLLENVPNHGWFPKVTVLPFISTEISSVLSTCVGITTGTNRTVFPLLIFILHFLVGFITIKFSIYTKSSFTLVASSIEFTSSIIALIQFINTFLKRITPDVIIIILFLLFVIIFLLLKFINSRRIRSVLTFYDTLYDINPQHDQEQTLDKRYQSPIQFVSDVLLTIENWHPILSSWKLFEYSDKRWPKSFLIFFLHARSISLFPSMNSSLSFMHTKMLHSQLSMFQSIYMKQFDCLIQSRQFTVSPKIEKRITDVQSRLNVLLSLLRRFWVNILQKSTSNFWDDVDKINKVLSDVDALLLQLTRDYPNNEDVWIEYYRFVVYIKHDIKESNTIKNKIHNLLTKRKQQPDLAMTLAVQVNPNIQSSVHDFVENNQLEEEYPYKSASNNNNNLADQINEENEDFFDFVVSDYSKGYKMNKNLIYGGDNDQYSDSKEKENLLAKKKNKDAFQQMQIATQDLIEHSKLGNVFYSIIICTVLTVLSIVFFCLFSNKYASDFTKKQKNSLSFLSNLSLFYYQLSYFNLFLITYPLFTSHVIKVDRSLMDLVAPNLFTTLKIIPIWNFDVQRIQNAIDEIRKLHSELIRSLYKLDKSDMHVKEIIKLIECESVYDGYTLGATVDRLLTTIESIFNFETVSYIEKVENLSIYPTFNATYQTIESIFNLSVDYLKTFHKNVLDEINGLMCLAMITTLLLVSISFVLNHYLFEIQNDAITNSFLFFPNSENRRVITKFGHQLAIDPDLTHLSSLTNKNNDNAKQMFVYILIFLFSFLPFCIGCLIIYYLAHNFKSVADQTTMSISTLYVPFTYMMLSMEAINHEYAYEIFNLNLNAYSNFREYSKLNDLSILEDTNLTDSNSSDANSSDLIVNDFYRQAERYLDEASRILMQGMWNNTCNIHLYFKSENHELARQFNKYFKELRIVRTKSLFELLITNEFPFSIDLLIASLKHFISLHLDSEILNQEERYLSLLYYFTIFSDANRNKPYFGLVENDVRTILDQHTSISSIVRIIVIVVQAAACVMMNLALLKKSTQIKKSLRFYLDLSPEILLQNNNAMTLLYTGKSGSDRIVSSFKNSDLILTSIPQGVFIANRDLVIIDYNQAFRNMVKSEAQKKSSNLNDNLVTSEYEEEEDDEEDEILNHPLTQIVNGTRMFGAHSWPIFVQHITEIFNGKRKPQFSEPVTVEFSPGVESNLIVNVIGLVQNFPAHEGESHLIDSVAVVIEDVTDEESKLKTLQEEKEEISKMIAKVLPKSFIDDLTKSDEESISFVVQNATIGFISIDFQSSLISNSESTYMRFSETNFEGSNNNSSNDNVAIDLQKKLSLYSDVFEIFDKLLESSDFQLICKVRTLSNIYMFAGGLFSRSGKTDKIEVQTCNFALKALSQAQSFMHNVNRSAEIRIGIHSGGPVMAGVLSVSKPSFQILGPVEECALKLISICEPWKIAISRAVYENIFSSGFRIFEKGEITLRNGNEVQVYLVSLDI